MINAIETTIARLLKNVRMSTSSSKPFAGSSRVIFSQFMITRAQQVKATAANTAVFT